MNSDQLRKLIDVVSESSQGVAEGSSNRLVPGKFYLLGKDKKVFTDPGAPEVPFEFDDAKEVLDFYKYRLTPYQYDDFTPVKFDGNNFQNIGGVAEGTYWAGSEGPDGVALDDPNDVMPDKKPMVKKLGPKARAKTQMLKMYGDGEITFRKTSNGGYFIQHEDDFGDTHSHQYDPKTGKVDFSGVTRSTYYGEGVAEGKRTLRDYMAESETAYSRPVQGDNFAINIREEVLLETYVVDSTDDAIVIHADNKIIETLASFGFLSEGDISQLEKDVADAPVKPIASMEAQDLSIADAGEYDYEGDMAKDDLETIVRAARRLAGMLDDNENMPEWVQSKINKAADYVDTAADYIESNRDEPGMAEGDMAEAKYQGREVPLGKPMKGDVKKSKVYVRGPKGNVVKVNFGQKGMKIKKNNPGRRSNFRARHNCDNPGPRHKARFWSCRAW